MKLCKKLMSGLNYASKKNNEEMHEYMGKRFCKHATLIKQCYTQKMIAKGYCKYVQNNFIPRLCW